MKQRNGKFWIIDRDEIEVQFQFLDVTIRSMEIDDEPAETQGVANGENSSRIAVDLVTNTRVEKFDVSNFISSFKGKPASQSGLSLSMLMHVFRTEQVTAFETSLCIESSEER